MKNELKIRDYEGKNSQEGNRYWCVFGKGTNPEHLTVGVESRIERIEHRTTGHFNDISKTYGISYTLKQEQDEKPNEDLIRFSFSCRSGWEQIAVLANQIRVPLENYSKIYRLIAKIPLHENDFNVIQSYDCYDPTVNTDI